MALRSVQPIPEINRHLLLKPHLLKPTLTLNLGLRYECSQPIREVNNLYGNFDPNSTYGIVQQGQPGVGNTLWKPNRKNFAPRLGFAWDTNGKGITVLRGGVSIMYSEPVSRYFMDNAPPNGSLGNISKDPSGACSGVLHCPTNLCFGGGTRGHTFGGSIDFGAPTLLPSVLNWNGVLFPQGGLACTTTSQCRSAFLWAQCTAVAPDPGTLGKAGCYVAGKSVMVPPLNGTYGTMGRNIFRDTGFADMDFSVFKDFTFKERFNTEFRVEVFNVLITQIMPIRTAHRTHTLEAATRAAPALSAADAPLPTLRPETR